jgi:hypothetical protein
VDLKKEYILCSNSEIRFLKSIDKDDKIKLLLDIGILDTEVLDNDWNEILKKRIKFWDKHGHNPNDNSRSIVKPLCDLIYNQRIQPIKINRSIWI